MEKDFWSAVFKLQQRLQTYQSQRTLLVKGSKKTTSLTINLLFANHIHTLATVL